MLAPRSSVAIVHDYLTQRGGAERVVLEMVRAFPGAPVYTSVYEPETTFPDFSGVDVRPMPLLQRLASLRRDHRIGLPIYGPAFGRLRIDADVVVCSSSGWAHATRSTGRKVVYCYNPPRWVWQRSDYLRDLPRPIQLSAFAMTGPLRWWDRRAASTADVYLTSSQAVSARISGAYGLTARVIPPPYAIDPTGELEALDGVAPGFMLCVSRLVPYKHVDVAVTSMAELPDVDLVVIGDGPDGERLRRLSPQNVTFRPRVSDAQLRWAYANCSGLLALSHEDYGLTPLEAAIFGKPTIALRFGGYLDTIAEGVTGQFVDRLDRPDVVGAIRNLLSRRWDEAAIQAHARTHSPSQFRASLQSVVRHASAT